MKIENQVCTLEQAKKLKELGITQDSMFYWVNTTQGLRLAYKDSYKHYGIVGENGTEVTKRMIIACAFTVAELGLMLPQGSYMRRSYITTEEIVGYVFRVGCNIDNDGYETFGLNEAEMRARLIINLIEREIITSKEIIENYENSL